MSGGLLHHNDEEHGPSHAVGHKSSKQQDRYSLERNQCLCADGKVCPDLQKQKPKSLDTADVVRDVEKGTKAVISANSSVYGERTFNNLRTNLVVRIP